MGFGVTVPKFPYQSPGIALLYLLTILPALSKKGFGQAKGPWLCYQSLT